MRRGYKKKHFYQLLIILFLCLGIGYAALMTDLSITGVANVTHSSWDVHFENLQVQYGSVTPDVAASIDSDTSISYEITLNQPGDFYDFRVDVVNEGTIDAMIESFSSKLNGTAITTLPSYINYSVTFMMGHQLLIIR